MGAEINNRWWSGGESKWSRSWKSNDIFSKSGGDYIIEVNGRHFV